MEYNYAKFNSPIGLLHLLTDGIQLCAVIFDKNWCNYKKNLNVQLRSVEDFVIINTQKQFFEYFEGKRIKFDLPLKISGTEFQKKSWKVLQSIPYGQTISYQEQAIRIKNSSAVRAVGAANGHNNISIIVPCHRVISKNGNLAGYAGGIDIKKKLLKLEGAI